MYKQLKIHLFLLFIFLLYFSGNFYYQNIIFLPLKSNYKIERHYKLFYISNIERKLTINERKKLDSLCKLYEINYNNLMLSINLESRGNKNSYNKNTGASGLIQILPLNKINKNICEIERIFMYLKKYKNISKISNNFINLQIIIFYPYALSQKSNYILGSEKGINYAEYIGKLNHLYDIDNNGYIEKKELIIYLNNYKNIQTKKFKNGQI